MIHRSYFHVYLLLVFGSFLLIDVEAETVILNSPQFNNGLAYLNKSSATPWSLAGQGLHSCPQATLEVDAYYALPAVYTPPAKEVVIDVAYTLQCCSHVLKIGLYSLNTPTLIHIPPRPMDNSYTHVADLTNTSIVEHQRSGVFNKISYVDMEGDKYLYIAFRTQGFCGSVDAIKIYYYKCPAVTGTLIYYPETPAPQRESRSVQISGRCMQQSFPATTASANTMICYSNGTSKVTGGCQCMAGYQNVTNSKCSACPPKTFKSSGGNYNCRVCGANVEDGRHPRTTMCQCKGGYWKPRAFMDAFHVNCEEPPSEPRNISIEAINPTGVSLRWTRPDRRGTGDDVWYSILCGTKSLISLTESIIITGLSPYTQYNVTISSKNNVTTMIEVTRAASVTFMTKEGLPSMVEELTYTRNDDNSVTVHWKEPKVKGSSSLSYAVIVNNGPLKILHVTNYTIRQWENTMHYNVTVMSRTSIGLSKRQTVTFSILTSANVGDKGNSEGEQPPDVTIVIGISVSGVVVVVLGTLVTYYLCHHRRKPNKIPPEDIELQVQDGGGVEENFDDNGSVIQNHRAVEDDDEDETCFGPPLGGVQPQPSFRSTDGLPLGGVQPQPSFRSTDGLPLGGVQPQPSLRSTAGASLGGMQPASSHRSQVRASVTGIQESSVKKQAMHKELDVSSLHIYMEIMPEVQEGDLHGSFATPNKQDQKIVLKKYKSGLIDMALAFQLKQFKHENIVSFQGIQFEAQNDWAVFKAAGKGPLDKYLQKQREKGIGYKRNQLKMALGVASGMVYLSNQEYVHKYLKAANIMVNDDEVCQISGFNLKKKGDPPCPLRTPSDDLKKRRLTIKSDVWSYGIVVWEILSFGESIDNKIKHGKRILPKPENCDTEIYSLMERCWEKLAKDRPDFRSIHKDLSIAINGNAFP